MGFSRFGIFGNFNENYAELKNEFFTQKTRKNNNV